MECVLPRLGKISCGAVPQETDFAKAMCLAAYAAVPLWPPPAPAFTTWTPSAAEKNTRTAPAGTNAVHQREPRPPRQVVSAMGMNGAETATNSAARTRYAAA